MFAMGGALVGMFVLLRTSFPFLFMHSFIIATGPGTIMKIFLIVSACELDCVKRSGWCRRRRQPPRPRGSRRRQYRRLHLLPPQRPRSGDSSGARSR